LGAGTWIAKLGFVRRLHLILGKVNLDLDIGGFSISRSILGIYEKKNPSFMIFLGYYFYYFLWREKATRMDS